MRYTFRKKHALATFGLLLFVCAIWMLKQEDEISKELSTSSVQDMEHINVMYPVGLIQHKKDQHQQQQEKEQQQRQQQREQIVVDDLEPSVDFAAPVETKRGNYLPLPKTIVEEDVPLPTSHQPNDIPNLKPDEASRTKSVMFSQLDFKLANKKRKKAKADKKIPKTRYEIPELTPAEMDEFHRRMEDYCNPPWKPLDGQEGQVSNEYTLHYVHVIARHGDRTPLTQLSLPNVTVDLDFNCDLERAKDLLPSNMLLSRFIASIMAQDEALPGWPQMPWFLRQLPIGAPARRCGIAQLTPTGWLQLMRLGEHVRLAYASKLVPHRAYFRNPNITKFKSTINARTQQSAFAFMFGFLPRLELRHGEWLQVAENVAFCPSNCSCRAFNSLEQAKKNLHWQLQKNNSEVQHLLKSVAAVLLKEPKVKGLPGITGLQEFFSALMCHKKPLPCGAYGCVTPKHLARIIAYTDRTSRELRDKEHSPHQKFARLNMHPLLSEIAMQMKRISHGASNHPKVAFYSGHDITLTPLLDALGLGDYHWPRYAANVIFELWSKSGEFFLRVLYNGQDKTGAVRFCRNVLNADGLCPLRNMLRFINKSNMAFFHVSSYHEACKLIF